MGARPRFFLLSIALPDGRGEPSHHDAVRVDRAPVELRGGIGVGKVAAYRPSVSDHAMRDQPHGGAQQRAEARHDLGVLYGRLAGERLDRNPMVSLVDPVEAGNPVDVDDVCRPSEAEVQERNERLATSENLRVL